MSAELNAVREALLVLAALVEHQLQRAIHAYFGADAAAARLVNAADADVDLLEQRLDDACVSALGARVLAADEMRFVVAAMKVGTLLERIGDDAIGLARAARTAHAPDRQLALLARHVRGMLADASEALGRLDALLALRVIADHSKARALSETTLRAIAEEARPGQAPGDTEALRALGRIASQTRSIARTVRYAAGELAEPERMPA
jgi:phosphate transport system protein